MDWSDLQRFATPEALTLVGVGAGGLVAFKLARWGVRKAAAAARALARPSLLAGALMAAGGGLVGHGCDFRGRRAEDPPLPALAEAERLPGAGAGAGLALAAAGATLGVGRSLLWCKRNGLD